MEIKEMDLWSLNHVPDPYLPPEAQFQVLVGVCNGKLIRTTAITKIEGNLVYTRNSVYRVMNPEPEYAIWCEEHDYYVPTIDKPFK